MYLSSSDMYLTMFELKHGNFFLTCFLDIYLAMFKLSSKFWLLLNSIMHD